MQTAQLGGMADRPEDHAATQRDLDRLEKRAGKNLVKFNRKHKVLHLGKNNPLHHYMLGLQMFFTQPLFLHISNFHNTLIWPQVHWLLAILDVLQPSPEPAFK